LLSLAHVGRSCPVGEATSTLSETTASLATRKALFNVILGQAHLHFPESKKKCVGALLIERENEKPLVFIGFSGIYII
jgi:hypothetical protein